MGIGTNILIGAVLVGGASVGLKSLQEARGYQGSVAAVEDRLEQMDFDQSMLTAFDVRKISLARGETREMRWTFSQPRRSGTASCTAYLKPLEPEKTDAEFDCAVDGDRRDMEMANAAAGLIKVRFTEHFAAAMENRPLDKRALGSAAATYAVSIQPMMAKRMSGSMPEQR